MVEEGDHVRITGAIERDELRGHPRLLPLVARDVRVDRNEKVASEAERKRRRLLEPAAAALGRPETGHGGRGVLQARPLRAAGRRAAHVVIAHGQEVGRASLVHQTLDEGGKAEIPLLYDAAARDGIARLNDELDREAGRRLDLRGLDHRLDDSGVLRLLFLALDLAARVPVGKKGEFRDARGVFFREQSDAPLGRWAALFPVRMDRQPAILPGRRTIRAGTPASSAADYAAGVSSA